MCDVDVPLNFLQKLFQVRKKRRIQLIMIVHMYFFFFFELLTDSEKIIDRPWYRKGCYSTYIMREVTLEDIAAPPRDGWKPLRCRCHRWPVSRQIPATCSSSPKLDPTRWHWAIHVALGRIHRRLAQNGGCKPDTLALGCTHWHWAIHNSVWLKSRCWALHAGVGLEMSVLPDWSYTLPFGSKRRYWIIHTSVGPYIVTLGCTRWRSWSMRSQGKNDNGDEKRSETHQRWALVPPSPVTACCWGLCQVSNFRCRSSQLECSGHSWCLNTVVSVNGRDPKGCREGCCLSSANMGYLRRGLQEGDRGGRIGTGQGIVDGGSCEQRVVMACDIVTFVTHEVDEHK